MVAATLLGMRVEVVLVPVSVQMGSSASDLRVVGFREGDAWAARRVVKGSANQTARSLIDKLPLEYQHVVAKLDLEPSRVAFKEEEANGVVLTLIYSIALPTPLADPDVPGAERWITLLEAGGSQAQASRRGSDLLRDEEPYANDLVEYWREELEEETRLFAFLPRYFTARQAREVYTAFWGYEQDPDGFATWSGIGKKKQGGVYSEYIALRGRKEENLLSAHVEAVLEADSTNVLGGSVGATLLCESASDGAVGLWPGASAVTSLPKEAQLPVLAAAALVAYQRPSRGPKPSWYKRRADTPIEQRLKELYTPRAVWVFPPREPGIQS
jgi:hypothetical protein